MSSMKSFKSRISQKKGNSISKINMSTQSVTQFNLKNLQFNVRQQIQFKLQKLDDRIIVAPYRMQITNYTGIRIFLFVTSTKEEYFNISPKKYILQNGSTYEVTIRVMELQNVQFQDYELQSFCVNWGRITQSQIANKVFPDLVEQKRFKCSFLNKDTINQILAQQTYQTKKWLQTNNNNKIKNKNILDSSHLSMSKRQQFARSGLNASDLNHDIQKPSLLRTNIIIGVAIVSFIIGFISS